MNNKLVTLEAYGVDEISKDLYSTAPQKELFPEEVKVEEQKAAPIGLLLGLNVVQHHPVPVKRIENFVLFEKSFGKCVSGTPVLPHYHKTRSQKLTLYKPILHLKISTRLKTWVWSAVLSAVIVNVETLRWAHQSFLSRNKRSLT